MPYFDRFDIAEAHWLIECHFNVSGVLQERKSNQRRRMSTDYQLGRMGFRPNYNLTYAKLTENGQAIYNLLLKEYNL